MNKLEFAKSLDVAAIDQSVLDELVVSHFDAQASSINNSGKRSQLDFLAQQSSAIEFLAMVREASVEDVTKQYPESLDEDPFAAYVASGGVRCVCGSDDIDCDVEFEDAGIIVKASTCNSCGMEWREEYKLERAYQNNGDSNAE